MTVYGIWLRWPKGLEHLSFRQRFDKDIEAAVFPPGLRTLKLGICFDKPIEKVKWPPGLERLVLGHYFNHPVEAVNWPPSLKSLAFGGIFDQPLGKVVWPPKLENLELGHAFSRDLGGISWPSGLKFLTVRSRCDPAKKTLSWLSVASPVATARRVEGHSDAPEVEEDLPPGLESSIRRLFARYTATGDTLCRATSNPPE